MKKLNQPQLNTKTYWNYIYTTPARSREYWERTYRFLNFLNYVKDGDKVIDLGCGVGIPCRLVQEKKKDCETWGVDISNEVIENNVSEEPKTTWKYGHIGNLSFLPMDYFDVAFCGEVIEHLDNPLVAFQDAYRVLKNNGKFIITTPIKNHIYSDEHQWEFEEQDIELLYKQVGFKNIKFEQLPNMEHTMIFFVIGEK